MENNRRKAINLFFILIFLSLIACNNNRVSPKDFVNWVDSGENGLIKEKEVNGYKIISKFIPAQYVAVKETYIENKEFDKSTYQKKLNELNSQYYIYLQISPTSGNQSTLRSNLKDASEYYYRIEYFNFLAQNDLYLITNDDTLNCSLSNFENNFEINPFNNWQISFEKPAKPLTGDLVFMWDDQALGIGRIRFTYNLKELNNIPTITL